MRTETITRNLYTFGELSEDAQEKAIDRLRDANISYEWWDGVYEDAERIGLKITGFDLDRNRHATGDLLHDAFYVADLIKKEHGEHCETHKLAATFQREWDALVEKHSDGITKDEVAEDNEYEFDEEADDLEEEFLSDLLEEYSCILEREYEYLCSDAAIIESINANGIEFTEDGMPA